MALKPPSRQASIRQAVKPLYPLVDFLLLAAVLYLSLGPSPVLAISLVLGVILALFQGFVASQSEYDIAPLESSWWQQCVGSTACYFTSLPAAYLRDLPPHTISLSYVTSYDLNNARISTIDPHSPEAARKSVHTAVSIYRHPVLSTSLSLLANNLPLSPPGPQAPSVLTRRLPAVFAFVHPAHEDTILVVSLEFGDVRLSAFGRVLSLQFEGGVLGDFVVSLDPRALAVEPAWEVASGLVFDTVIEVEAEAGSRSAFLQLLPSGPSQDSADLLGSNDAPAPENFEFDSICPSTHTRMTDGPEPETSIPTTAVVDPLRVVSPEPYQTCVTESGSAVDLSFGSAVSAVPESRCAVSPEAGAEVDVDLESASLSLPLVGSASEAEDGARALGSLGSLGSRGSLDWFSFVHSCDSADVDAVRNASSRTDPDASFAGPALETGPEMETETGTGSQLPAHSCTSAFSQPASFPVVASYSSSAVDFHEPEANPEARSLGFLDLPYSSKYDDRGLLHTASDSNPGIQWPTIARDIERATSSVRATRASESRPRVVASSCTVGLSQSRAGVSVMGSCLESSVASASCASLKSTSSSSLDSPCLEPRERTPGMCKRSWVPSFSTGALPGLLLADSDLDLDLDIGCAASAMASLSLPATPVLAESTLARSSLTTGSTVSSQVQSSHFWSTEEVFLECPASVHSLLWSRTEPKSTQTISVLGTRPRSDDPSCIDADSARKKKRKRGLKRASTNVRRLRQLAQEEGEAERAAVVAAAAARAWGVTVDPAHGGHAGGKGKEGGDSKWAMMFGTEQVWQFRVFPVCAYLGADGKGATS